METAKTTRKILKAQDASASRTSDPSNPFVTLVLGLFQHGPSSFVTVLILVYLKIIISTVKKKKGEKKSKYLHLKLHFFFSPPLSSLSPRFFSCWVVSCQVRCSTVRC